MSEHANEPELEPEADEPVEPIADEADELEPEADEPVEPIADEADEPEARAPTAGELKRFEAENTRHEKALAKIVGRDWAGFGVCADCGGVGFRPTVAMDEPELVPMPGVIECPGCKGYGRLRTPSRVPGQELQICVDCAGNGWKRESPVPADQPQYVTPSAAGNGYATPPGHVLVKVDPNAPDVPITLPPQAAAMATNAP